MLVKTEPSDFLSTVVFSSAWFSCLFVLLCFLAGEPLPPAGLCGGGVTVLLQ